ncbi:APO protein 3, mitochondrial-like [Magnolia sinica]|uniref:APO protein 3, mitochondrial-like n=1 Tax=Magnolia sinica TaxID=86752 RepID=UPI0026580AF1|nr:APO protein 3, mitochondrial-like [Magnolia sinica]
MCMRSNDDDVTIEDIRNGDTLGWDQNSWHYEENSNELSVKTLESWLEMKSGAELMMKTCGYCPEVQVGPKGHRARLCQAHKHQLRDGQHAWQEATIDDLMPPVYVWHVRDPQGSGPLVDRLKRYYVKLPAAVELFSQGGAHVGDEYQSMMRLDVVSPDRDEVDLVA